MANMTISVDEDLKREFSGFCNEVGLTASSVLNVCMVTIARERRIPFQIRAPYRPGIDERRALSEDIDLSRRQIAEGKGVANDAVFDRLHAKLLKMQAQETELCR